MRSRAASELIHNHVCLNHQTDQGRSEGGPKLVPAPTNHLPLLQGRGIPDCCSGPYYQELHGQIFIPDATIHRERAGAAGARTSTTGESTVIPP